MAHQSNQTEVFLGLLAFCLGIFAFFQKDYKTKTSQLAEKSQVSNLCGSWWVLALNLNKIYLSLSIRVATASVINWNKYVFCFTVRFHVEFHKVTFSESVIILKTHRRSNQKDEGSRIHVPFGSLERSRQSYCRGREDWGWTGMLAELRYDHVHEEIPSHCLREHS